MPLEFYVGFGLLLLVFQAWMTMSVVNDRRLDRGSRIAFAVMTFCFPLIGYTVYRREISARDQARRRLSKRILRTRYDEDEDEDV